ncbi:ABC transporter substrate-binding protein [Falsarthrobacter nasiphocae]|uniref:Oligopeptide transport system substrate-binding protein n=1 Tax=Falsarthrobacter nasiphocae TaxID=189863 RepID=A0AAE4C5W6_9MICC|nr:ABC transporter substrate-binding protein [Falsarthrobacter nasiphocae]MDR6891502.1 oligopeptide transport system substrate-binding protein [Falsarthrobacter nasiphocae]
MRFARTTKIVGLATLSALALAACGGGSSDSGSSASGDAGAIITASSVEPENPLVPTNTSENGGGRVVENIFNGLISYDENGKSVNDLAESIETKDSKVWTIKIKSGKKFTNGEAVTAKSFVDAWNYGAAAKNAQKSSYFFESIEGYDKVSAEGSQEDKMSGLKVIDDTTFEVTLSQPEADFAQRLGYSAYVPIPESAYKDMKAFGENPVGYGPYKMKDKGAWQHNAQIELVKNDDYDGPEKAQNGGITFKLYQNADTSYQDLLADNLDVLDQIPTSAMQNYKNDLGDRYSDKAYAGNQTFSIPYYLDNFKGEAGKLRRQAISMAINRDEIIKVIFQGTRTPATDFTSPTLEGYSKDLKGSEYTTFNKDKAKELWEEAEKIQPYDDSKPFTIAYNADASHKQWVDAVSNQLSQNLGIKAEGKPYTTFKELRTAASSGKLTGAARAGWLADYPSLYNFLGPVYGKGASSNDAKYDNPAFDKLLKEGLGAKSAEDATKKFQEADALLLEDMPNVPLWYSTANVGWSNKVSNVTTSWNGTPMYYKVTKKG